MKVSLDTNVLVAACVAEHEHHARALPLLQSIHQGDHQGFVSAQQHRHRAQGNLCRQSGVYPGVKATDNTVKASTAKLERPAQHLGEVRSRTEPRRFGESRNNQAHRRATRRGAWVPPPLPAVTRPVGVPTFSLNSMLRLCRLHGRSGGSFAICSPSLGK